MDIRINQINKFTLGLADLKLYYHPLKQSAVLHFVSTVRDLYGDSSRNEDFSISKVVIIRKSKDLEYVQDLFDSELEEENTELPWIVICTISDFKSVMIDNEEVLRLPKNDDYFEINNFKYRIAAVKPINRDKPVVLECLVYPERNSTQSKQSQEDVYKDDANPLEIINETL